MPSLPTEIPSFMTWAWGKVILEKGLSKNKTKKTKQKKGKASPFPLLKSLEKTVYFSHDGKESKSE